MKFEQPKAPAQPKGQPHPKPGATDRSVAVGDHVFYRDNRGNHYCGEVRSVGRDGFCAKAGEAMHRVTHDKYVGHKSRRAREATIEHEGADGNLARLDCGRVIFMPHPPPEEPMSKAILPLLFKASGECAPISVDDRERWPSGYLKPIAGDRVFISVPGFARPVIVSGKVHATAAGKLRVRVTSVSGPVTSETAIGSTLPLTEQWRCFGDYRVKNDMQGQRDPDRIQRAADVQAAFLDATSQAVLAARATEGHRAPDFASLQSGDSLCGWAGGDRVDYVVASADDYSIQLYEVGAPERWVGKGKGRTRLCDYSITIYSPEDRQLAMERFTVPPADMGKALGAGLVLFAKAGPIANRPGLALQDVQTKRGTSKRWVSTRTEAVADGKKQRAATGKPDPAPEGQQPKAHQANVGEHVTYHVDGAKKPGSGKVVATGKDGMTVEGVGGQRTKVKWDQLDKGHAHKPERYGVSKATDEDVSKLHEPVGDTEESRGEPVAHEGVTDEQSAYRSAAQGLKEYKDAINRTGGLADKLQAQVFDNDFNGMMTFLHEHPEKSAIIIAPIKGRDRAAEKASKDGWDMTRDLVRGSVIVPSLDDVAGAVKAVKDAGFKVTRIKNRFHKDVGGYRDILMSVRMPGGHVAELQIHTKAMIEAKEKYGGHSHYEVARKHQEAQERGEQLDADQQGELDHANDHMAELYGQTWRAMRG